MSAFPRIRHERPRSAGANYYQRISIANQLMQDRQWIDAEFKGDDYKAATVLEIKYFHDLAGSMTIYMLLQIYRRFPEESSWKASKYNLRNLYAKCKPAVEHRSRQSVKTADYERVVQEAKELRFEANKLSKQVTAKESELGALRKRVAHLETENARLKGRIEQLERVVSGKLAS